jgi:hypothetical protein
MVKELTIRNKGLRSTDLLLHRQDPETKCDGRGEVHLGDADHGPNECPRGTQLLLAVEAGNDMLARLMVQNTITVFPICYAKKSDLECARL